MLNTMKIKPSSVASHKVEFSDELISRSIAGDKDALEELASSCLSHIWQAVYLTSGGSPDADDIAQNAVIDAFTGLPTFRGTGSFSAWLNRISMRAVYRHMRRRAFWALIPFSDRLDVFPDAPSRAPDRKAEERRLLDQVARHMRTVRIKNRLPVVLSLVHGYSVVEIADILGCSVEAAKKRLQRGRMELGARLQKDPYCRKIAEEVGI